MKFGAKERMGSFRKSVDKGLSPGTGQEEEGEPAKGMREKLLPHAQGRGSLGPGVLPPTCCVTLGKSLNFSGFWCLPNQHVFYGAGENEMRLHFERSQDC